jgi:peptidoglycan hydrolase CwlO-like protein
VRLRRIPFALTVVAAFAVVAFAPHGANAETDTERERDRVRQERAAAAANVDALNGDKAEVEAALADLNEQVEAEEAALSAAQAEVDKAEADEARAQQGIRDTTARLAGLEDQLRAQMIETYVNPEGDTMSSVLDATSALDVVTRQAILEGRTADDEDLADQVRAAQTELQAQRRAAAAAGERAERKRAEVEERLDSVEAARDQQQGFAAQVQARIDAEVARAIELGQRDAELSRRILQEQALLQAQLLAAQQQQEAQAAAAAAAAGPTYDSDGGESSGPVAAPGGVTGAGTGTGGISLCNAGGITVNCQIAEQVRSMIAAAASAGVSLSGGGYRDPSRQIALREQNCGSSYYAIYQMPSSQCSPPTARPGSSQHELGLAIDFSNCSSRSTACYRWLAGNASRFGMYNLPSEPWHWSVNGN